jgi:AcrR family transcriptional regulator
VGRVRTEEKRAEIVRVATEAFDELGYDRCSMAEISERVGGSKATLYGYFCSKEDLLRAVLQCQVAGEFDRRMEEFHEAADLRDALIHLGIAYHRKRLSSLPVANIRSIVNQPPCSTMGKEFYESVIRPAFQRMADRFERLMDQGRLKRADPWTAIMHWKGLNDWDLFERRMIGAISGPDDVDIEKIATEAADAFLKLYGVADDEFAGAKASDKA